MVVESLCLAIREKHLVKFNYFRDAVSGVRIVEPHMVAYNESNQLSLSAWFISGASESQAGPGWREYLVPYMTDVMLLPEKFLQPRPGYKPDGGKKFHSVQCGL